MKQNKILENNNISSLQVLTVDLTKCTYLEINGNKFEVSKRYVRYCPLREQLFESDKIEFSNVIKCRKVTK